MTRVSISPHLALALILSVPGGPASAAAPTNDNFANRLVIAGGTASGINAEATLEPLETDGPFAVRSKTVWWKWTAPSTGWYEVNTANSNFDTVLGVGIGNSIATYSEIVFNDDDNESGKSTSRLLFRATAFTEYAIAVGGFEGATGNVELSIASAFAPELRLAGLSISPDPADVTSSAQVVTATISVTGTQEFDSGEFSIDDGNFFSLVAFDTGDLSSTIGNTEIYTVTIEVPRYLPPGNFIAGVTLFGDLGEVSIYGEDHIGFLPIPAGANSTLAVQNTGDVDTTGPALTATHFSTQAIDVSAGLIATTLTATITDDLSGFASGLMNLVDLNGIPQRSFEFDTSTMTSGTPADGIYTIEFELDQTLPDGFYFVELVLTDLVNNSTFYGAYLENPPFPGPDDDILNITNNAPGYPEWIAPFALAPPDDEPGMDPDKDGLTNLQEYAFNLNPKVPDARPLGSTGASGTPTASVDTSGNLALTYPVRKLAPDLIYTTNWGDDLALWSDNATFITREFVDANWDRVTSAENPGGANKFFGRVEVFYNP